MRHSSRSHACRLVIGAQWPLSDRDKCASARLLSVSSLAGATAAASAFACDVPFTTPKTCVTSVESGIDGAVNRRVRVVAMRIGTSLGCSIRGSHAMGAANWKTWRGRYSWSAYLPSSVRRILFGKKWVPSYQSCSVCVGVVRVRTGHAECVWHRRPCEHELNTTAYSGGGVGGWRGHSPMHRVGSAVAALASAPCIIGRLTAAAARATARIFPVRGVCARAVAAASASTTAATTLAPTASRTTALRATAAGTHRSGRVLRAERPSLSPRGTFAKRPLLSARGPFGDCAQGPSARARRAPNRRSCW